MVFYHMETWRREAEKRDLRMGVDRGLSHAAKESLCRLPFPLEIYYLILVDDNLLRLPVRQCSIHL